MMVIKGGMHRGIEYSCMLEADRFVPDEKTSENGRTLYGFLGIAVNKNDQKSMLYFDENMHFVKGHLLSGEVNL